jgi:hypothetical protein
MLDLLDHANLQCFYPMFYWECFGKVFLVTVAVIKCDQWAGMPSFLIKILTLGGS